MLKPTLKKNDFLIDVNDSRINPSTEVVDVSFHPIRDEKFELIGQSALVSVLIYVDIPDDVTKQLSFIPVKDDVAFLSNSPYPRLSQKEDLLASTLGLFFRNEKNKLYALKLIKIKGASSPAFKPETCVLKNSEANEELGNLKANSSLLTPRVKSVEQVVTSSLSFIIDHHNQEIEYKHSIRFPSFILMLLRNQKARSFGNESKELSRYNELVTRNDSDKPPILSKSDLDFVVNVNNRLKEDLKLYLKTEEKFDFDRFDKQYSSRLLSFIDLVPDDFMIGSKNEADKFLGEIKKINKYSGESN